MPGTHAYSTIACAPGSYQPDEGQSACIPCPPGTIEDASGAATCNACPAGTFEPSSGSTATTCTDCAPDTFALDPGSASCDECPGGISNVCSGNGVCSDGPTGYGTCSCEIGFAGQDCGSPAIYVWENFDDQDDTPFEHVDPNEPAAPAGPNATWTYPADPDPGGGFLYRLTGLATPGLQPLALSNRPPLTESMGAYSISAEVSDLYGTTAASLGSSIGTGNGYVLGCAASGCRFSRIDAFVPTGIATVLFPFDPSGNYQLLLTRSGPDLEHHEAVVRDLVNGKVVAHMTATDSTYKDVDMVGGVLVSEQAPILGSQVAASFDNFLASQGGDGDADGLNALLEINAGTFMYDPDSDDDGLLDGEELGTGHFEDEVAILTTPPVVPDGPRSVDAADIDGDGDLDVLSASQDTGRVAWYENDGTPDVSDWPAYEISSTGGGKSSLYAADIDGDGDVDVVSGSTSISWYENHSGSMPPTWTEHELATPVTGIQSVHVADVDGDNDLDVLAASWDANTVTWYENSGTPTSVPWTGRVISASGGNPYYVDSGDLDGDGDLDVLSARLGNDTIAWYESDGASPPGWTEHTISTDADGPYSLDVADVDGDGRLDVLSSSVYDNVIAWYPNDGTPAVGPWTQHVISTSALFARSVHAADVDGDGDIDVLSASSSDARIAYYENDGTPDVGPWRETTLSNQISGASDVHTADIDGDGDLDVLATGIGDKVSWFEQKSFDPLNPDQNSNSIPDGFDDQDADGRSNPVELAAGTDPFVADTDGDGLCDGSKTVSGVCIAGEDTNDDGILDPGESDPLVVDSDGDGIDDGTEVGLGSSPVLTDSDADGIADDVELGFGTNPALADTDGDGLCDYGVAVPTICLGLFEDVDQDGVFGLADGETDPGVADTDGDGIDDGTDVDPLFPFLCSDSDSDTCDDCAISGSVDPANDGADLDGDGLCDAGDLDDDADGVPDTSDPEPLSNLVCADSDLDTCDDCAISGSVDPANDGADLDGDGLCDAGDLDDDADGIPDASDPQPANPFACGDSDLDTCDDCAIAGSFDPANDDVADYDADGLCDAGDPDDDNDGVLDDSDEQPWFEYLCEDSDADTCDDCSVVGSVDPTNDGADFDADGVCDAGDPDDDNDGFTDVDEIAAGTDPFDASSFPGANPVPALPLGGLLALTGALAWTGWRLARLRRPPAS